jgi:hypothetical protein
MSVRIMARVWAHSQRKDGELLVMLALADFANDAGESWPSIPVLAQKARLTERQTRRVLIKLEEASEIRRVKSNGGRNRRNHYFITLSENPDNITLKELQCKNNPVIGDTKTLTPMSGALNRHRTINIANDKSSPKVSRQNGHPKNSKAPDGYREAVALYHDLFVGRIGAKPDFDGRDGKLLSGLLKAHGAAEVQELLKSFFEHPPAWVEKGSKFTIPAFKSAYTEILAQSRKGQQRMGVL